MPDTGEGAPSKKGREVPHKRRRCIGGRRVGVDPDAELGGGAIEDERGQGNVAIEGVPGRREHG